MKILIILTIFAIGLANAGQYKMIKEWAKKIGHHHLLTSCWGEKSTMKYYLAMTEFTDECQQLTPSFDIEIFGGAADLNQLGLLDDNDVQEAEGNPFITGQLQGGNQGFQTLPAAVNPFGVNRFGSANQQRRPASPWEAWMSMWAPYYAQSQGRGFQSSGPFMRRSKRAIDPPSKDELRQFAEDLKGLKTNMKDNIGNLTCVLSKFGALDDKLQINLNHFTRSMWTWLEEQPEADFKNKFIAGYKDCYKYSQSIPKDVLENKPLMKQFGRQMKFFKCAKMLEISMCVKKDLHSWIVEMYGEPDESTKVKLGLPTDKYEAAAVSYKVLEESKSGSYKFVADFFFGQ